MGSRNSKRISKSWSEKKVDQPDKSGKTPIDYARNNKEMTEVLEGVKMAKKTGRISEKDCSRCDIGRGRADRNG